MSRIVTINRQFGSGGREVGKRLADELECAYYDKELLDKLAEETGLSADFIERFDETTTRNYGFTFARAFVTYVPTPMEQLQIEQHKLLKSIAPKGDSVIIGRCANYILSEYNPFRVFIYSSDMDFRVKRCFDKVSDDHGKLSASDMEKKIVSIDKERKKYYEYQTGQKWLDMTNYNLCIDSSMVGVKNAVQIILNALST